MSRKVSCRYSQNADIIVLCAQARFGNRDTKRGVAWICLFYTEQKLSR